MNLKQLSFIFSSIFFATLIFGIQSPAFTQPASKIDSLRYELSKAVSVDDSIYSICRYVWNSWSSDKSLAFNYGQKALELSCRTQNKVRIAEAYDAAALGYWVNGNFDRAKELYTEELKIGQAYDIPLRIGWANYNLAEICLQQGNISATKEYALKSRMAFKQNNSIKMTIYCDWLLLKIDRNGRNAYVDSAIIDYKLAESYVKDPNILLDLYLNIVYLYGQLENRTQSMLYAVKAMEIAEKTNDKKAILKASYQIGNYLRDYQHNYGVALLYYQRVLNISKEDGCETGVPSALNDIGIVHKFLGNDSLAFSYFHQSLEIAERLKHRHSQSDAYKNIGELYYQKKQYKEALSYFLKSYEIGCDKCSHIAFHPVLVDIGNVYLNAKDHANALVYFKKSLSLADAVHARYEQAVSRSALADFYISANKSEFALKNLYAALEYAVNSRSLTLQKEVSLKLSGVYDKSNNYQKAFQFLKLTNKISDSLKVISEAENLSRLETKFDFQNLKAQKDLELRENQIQADAEISKQAQLKYLFIVAFVLVAILGMVIYIGFRRKQKDSKVLAEQKKQIEEMAERVHDADQKKLNFFSNISHELRTPLTLILGPIEKLLKENLKDQNTVSLLKIVQRNTLQLYYLINQLLEIRKLDAHQIKLKTAQGDIAGYCKEIFSTFAHVAEENEIQYRYTPSNEPFIGWFDRDILEKVLNNLLSNAFKYTQKHGNINVIISPHLNGLKEIQHVNILIKDDGKGIPQNQIHYIFDRYYQVENANKGFNTGTGIGLAYTKELIELHKGEICVESELNRGTTFTITLPIHELYYSLSEKIQSREHIQENESPDFRHKYLVHSLAHHDNEILEGDSDSITAESNVMLIVEDNDDLREYFKNIFKGKYTVYEAADGNKGYQLAIELIPDIIISDIMIPGMDGLEMCRKLKGDLHTSHIPILILTAKTGDEYEIEGMQTGADDYLTKPFNSEILSVRVNRLAESKNNLREYFTREFLLNPKEVKLASPEDEFLKKAVKVVEDNISNPNLNVEMLMHELCVSRMHLHRKLKALTNYSANTFIRNIRLKRAAQLLRQTSLNITEVLYESGFNSPSYFSACFKTMYGCMPKEYSSTLQD